MRYLTILILLMFTALATAGPNEDRVQAYMDALKGSAVLPGVITRRLNNSVVIYQAWLPTEIVVVGTEDFVSGQESCVPDDPVTTDIDESMPQCDVTSTRDITEERIQDPSIWTREKIARFFLQWHKREDKIRNREIVEQNTRTDGLIVLDATVKAAGDASDADE